VDLLRRQVTRTCSVAGSLAPTLLDKLSEHDLGEKDLDLVADGVISQWIKDAMI
jgi:phage FluMu protein gp41